MWVSLRALSGVSVAISVTSYQDNQRNFFPIFSIVASSSDGEQCFCPSYMAPSVTPHRTGRKCGSISSLVWCGWHIALMTKPHDAGNGMWTLIIFRLIQDTKLIRTQKQKQLKFWSLLPKIRLPCKIPSSWLYYLDSICWYGRCICSGTTASVDGCSLLLEAATSDMAAEGSTFRVGLPRGGPLVGLCVRLLDCSSRPLQQWRYTDYS
jgi:hypothetical protein